MSNQQPRPRKQRFPRMDRRRPYGSTGRGVPMDDDFLSDDESVYFNKRPRHSSMALNRPYRPLKPPYGSKDGCPANCRIDKRARDEHNEQERSRRRELAVIYELIRCSFSEDDLRYLEPYSGPKSIDKLSYPQVLQVAYHLLREEQHNLMLFERTLDEMKRIEKELVHVGLSVPQRPFYPSITDSYRKVVQVVDNLLKHDKSARTPDGVYEVTPAERAAMGNQQLATLRPRPCGTYPDLSAIGSSYPDVLYPSRRTRNDPVQRPRISDLAHLHPTDTSTSIWHKVGRKLRRSSSAASITTGLDSHPSSYTSQPHSPVPCTRHRGHNMFFSTDYFDDEDVKPLLNSLIPPVHDDEEDIKPLLSSLVPSVVGDEEDDTDVMIDFLPQLD